jgi:hypothetical protein
MIQSTFSYFTSQLFQQRSSVDNRCVFRHDEQMSQTSDGQAIGSHCSPLQGQIQVLGNVIYSFRSSDFKNLFLVNFLSVN